MSDKPKPKCPIKIDPVIEKYIDRLVEKAYRNVLKKYPEVYKKLGE